MLPSESPIFAEQDDLYIYFFTAYGWPVRLEIQNHFLAQKVLMGLKGRSTMTEGRLNLYIRKSLTDSMDL